MKKFAHMADLHLGAHREPALRQLEMKVFHEAMDRCISGKVDFVLISGDLFHVGIPDLEIVMRQSGRYANCGRPESQSTPSMAATTTTPPAPQS
jgi:DNA repair exonuclease SbcCD nuclease subunit